MKRTSIQRRLLFLFMTVIAVAIAYNCFPLTRTAIVDGSDSVQEPDGNLPIVDGSEPGITIPPSNTPTQQAWVQRKVFYNGSVHEGKQVALTFDDGPDDITTPKILDILKANHIKATFFIVGAQAKAHPDMVKRIIREGHAIGNHSWSHPEFNKISIENAIKQVKDTQDELQSITGFRPALFRPPYGALTEQEEAVIHDMNMNIVNWSVDTRDWAGTPTPAIMNLIKRELFPGGIILQHCSGGKNHLSNTVEALKQLIPELHNRGYSFVTIPKLLHLPEFQ